MPYSTKPANLEIAQSLESERKLHMQRANIKYKLINKQKTR